MNANFDAVIFDMDGTLVESLLDFGAIRDELGIPRGEGIIETIDNMAPERREIASRTLIEREMEGARRATLIDGAEHTVTRVRDAGLKSALITRNAEEAMQWILESFKLPFDLTWSRKRGNVKPRPEGIFAACAEMGVSPDKTVCIGDFHYDITAANAAGATSVLLARDGRPGFADEADHVISELPQLLTIIGI